MRRVNSTFAELGCEILKKRILFLRVMEVNCAD